MAGLPCARFVCDDMRSPAHWAPAFLRGERIVRVRLAATLAALTLVLAGLVAVSASTATSSDAGNSLSSSRGNEPRLGNSL